MVDQIGIIQMQDGTIAHHLAVPHTDKMDHAGGMMNLKQAQPDHGVIELVREAHQRDLEMLLHSNLRRLPLGRLTQTMGG